MLLALLGGGYFGDLWRGFRRKPISKSDWAMEERKN
jgi:hypothetical protein